MSFLKRLHEKPSHVKSQIAFLGAILVTGVIAMVWMTTIPARLGSLGSQIKDTDTTQAAVVGGSLQDFLTGMESGVSNLGEEGEGEEDAVPEPARPGVIPDESAFKDLMNWRTSTTTPQPSTTPPEVGENSPSTPHEGVTSPRPTTLALPPPSSQGSTGTPSVGGGGRTILIGTSTKSTSTTPIQ